MRNDFGVRGETRVISLTYLSYATEPLDRQQLEDLLRVSRDRNAQQDVTGMLLYVDLQFIQTLEGEERAVNATMERIRADPRHHSVDVTLVDEIEGRSFVGWSMGFKILSGEAVAALPGFTNYLEHRSESQREIGSLGRAGKFHRAFRDAY